jgi:hypothetical protein
MKRFVVAAVLALALSTGTAVAATAPIMNIAKTQITAIAPGRDMHSAIKGALEGRGWTIRSEQPGLINAHLLVRVHTADIAISYDANSYSITYVGSENLDYDAKKSRIHRNYNRWIANLDMDIKKRL